MSYNVESLDKRSRGNKGQRKYNPALINKSVNLKNNKSDIKLERITRHLDRLQLNVMEGNDIYRKLIDKFKSMFKYIGLKWNEGKKARQKIKRFRYKHISLRVIRNFSPDYNVLYRFSISISNPDDEIQKILCDILAELIPDRKILSEKVSVSQAEFALDLYPEKLVDLYSLKNVLAHSVVLNYSRIGAYNDYEETEYQGKNGDVRKGSKGLRCYPKIKIKSKKVRIELQANKKMLKYRGINIFSLPLRAYTINIFDHISFRYGLNGKTLLNLVLIKCKKQWPNFCQWSQPRKVTLANATESLLFNKINEYGTYPFDFNDSVTKSVAYQIDVFKELKAEWKFSNQVNQFFPKNERIIEDIQNMRVSRLY